MKWDSNMNVCIFHDSQVSCKAKCINWIRKKIWLSDSTLFFIFDCEHFFHHICIFPMNIVHFSRWNGEKENENKEQSRCVHHHHQGNAFAVYLGGISKQQIQNRNVDRTTVTNSNEN